MTNTEMVERLARHFAENPQYLSRQKARILAGCHSAALSDLKVGLTREGFTFEEKGGYLVLTNALLSPDWVTGGITGGSCWGGEPNQSRDAEEEPAWLESFLERFAPEISFLKFRRLQQKCSRHEYSIDEYYGNSTVNAFEILKASDILEALGA